MSLWSRKPFIAIRVFGTRGQYPDFEIRTPTHLYVPSQHLVWSAVIQPPLPADWEIGEVTPLVPEEIRLSSAIALCEAETWENGLPILLHHANSHQALDAFGGGVDLKAPDTFQRLQDLAASLAPHKKGERAEHYAVRQLGSRADAIEVLQQIDSSDELILAGLARLLGATRVLSADEPEEAAISLFISMGAALEFIRLHLCTLASNSDVPFSEVYGYCRRTFAHGDEVAEYFENRYEERILATHPSSRFGEFWAPPLMMGDVYHLQKTLIGLYRHILLGETEGW